MAEKGSHNRPMKNPECALYVVATPIGNLDDISLRALETLAAADVIAAEDTRMTARLLAHYRIAAKRLMALHQHNERAAAETVLGLLAQGQNVALVSDAGTPAVSDPGALVVAAARHAGYRVIPIPGANAAMAALCAAGWPAPHFLFYGFLPNKSAARRNALEALRALPYTLVFYEAPHRVHASVSDLLTVLGGDRQILFARELTKLHETLHECLLADAIAWLDADPNNMRGEFVVLVSGAPQEQDVSQEEAERVLQLLQDALPLKQAVALAAQITGAGRNALYQRALARKQDRDA